MSRNIGEFKIVLVVPTGTGSKRITIPKEILTAVLGDSEYAAVGRNGQGQIVVEPVTIRMKRR